MIESEVWLCVCVCVCSLDMLMYLFMYVYDRLMNGELAMRV
jgi:hypothetical protein